MVTKTRLPNYKLEIDFPSNREDGTMPMLDHKVWTEQKKTKPIIMHEFYSNDVSSKAVIMPSRPNRGAQSASRPTELQ